MASEITKIQLEIPSIELPELSATLLSVEQLTEQVAPLYQRARAIEVKTRTDYEEVGQILSDTRNLKKQGAAHFSTPLLIVDRVRTFLKTKLQKHENACTEVEAACLPKMKGFEQAELAAAKAEQDKLNKQAAKKGEAPVEVAPSLPPVSGYRRTTNYYAEVMDADKLLKAWAKGDKELRKFITIDHKELNAEARRVKDPAKLEKAIPGIRAWKE